MCPQTLPTTQYELEIVAKDMAGSEVGLTGTATATITITDRNDHAPEFTHSLVGGTFFSFFLSFLKLLFDYTVHDLLHIFSRCDPETHWALF